MVAGQDRGNPEVDGPDSHRPGRPSVGDLSRAWELSRGVSCSVHSNAWCPAAVSAAVRSVGTLLYLGLVSFQSSVVKGTRSSSSWMTREPLQEPTSGDREAWAAIGTSFATG